MAEKEQFDNAIRSNWGKVVEIYSRIPRVASVSITSSGETALHLAVSNGHKGILENLLKALGSEAKGALQIRNELGNTPLHLAAAMGNSGMCECMTEVDKDLLKQRNNEGHTPLFLATFYGRMNAFMVLHRICKLEGIEQFYRGPHGDTILHIAIKGEHLKLAFFIMNNHRELISFLDERGWSPLHLLAQKPSLFRSCTYFSCLGNIVYSCITVQELPDQKDNYAGITIQELPDQIDDQTGRQSRNIEAPSDQRLPPNYSTCSDFLKLICSVLLVIFGCGLEEMKLVCNKLMLNILGLGFEDIKYIKKIKEKHVWSLQMVNKLLDKPYTYDYDVAGRSRSSTSTSNVPDINDLRQEETNQKSQDSNDLRREQTNQNVKDADAKPEMVFDRKETPILTAVSSGIKEIVEPIIDKFPLAIHDRNSQKRNIVMLAAENRQPHLFELFKQKKIEDSVYHAVDIHRNSALHLAANYNKSSEPWTILGDALQMQWEIKWYEHVMNCVGPDSLTLYNKDNKTAMEIFTETHRDLVKEGGEWLRKTSDSCSVVAALIATVAFAASATVPGSTEKGKPVLEKDLAFQVFSISSLVSLCFSVTSLVMFLAILTSRYQEKEFKLALLKKLLWGASSLLISIAAVLVSFCSGHFFILNDRLRSVAVPIKV